MTTLRGDDGTRFSAARLRAIEMQPFLASALFALTPVRADGLDTFAVDERWRLYIDPVRLQSWTVDEVAGVLLHEVAHVVRDHAGRARDMLVADEDRTRWNVAADAEINDDLVDDGVPLPEPYVHPELLGLPCGKAAEMYFVALESRTLPDHVDCGAGCHGELGDGAIGALIRAIEGAAAGLGPVEVDLVRRQVAVAVLVHRRAHGQLAGGWLRWAEATLHPAIDWRRLLASRIRASIGSVAGASDYTYRRPARRRVPGVVLPALHRPLPKATIVIDTSGSMSDAMLEAAWSEVHGCLRRLGVRRELLSVFSTDTVARRLDGAIGRTVALVGGGGTDMGAGLRAATAERLRPDLIVVLTDGISPWPADPPPCRVVVGLIGDEGESWLPEWADVVHIPADAV